MSLFSRNAYESAPLQRVLLNVHSNDLIQFVEVVDRHS